MPFVTNCRPPDRGAELDDLDWRIIAAIQDGLPFVERPYAAIARGLELSEGTVIERIGALLRRGVIKRLGVVLRHHEIGYRANAMVVWDIPDDAVDASAARIIGLPFVSLCYRRPRRPPDWPYNLFCMIHGYRREDVLQQVETLVRECGLDGYPREVLFSRRRFKQRGARYVTPFGTGPRGATPPPVLASETAT